MITSTSNPAIQRIRELQARRRARDEAGLFVIEGARLAEEAARANVPAQIVVHTDDLDPRGRAAVEALARLGAEVRRVSTRVMSAASATKTPSGLLAVVPFPALAADPLSLAVVLDRVADPGNLGAILRAADAAGVQAAFLAPGTVDAYNPKVVRAAMGAHFHLPIVESEWGELRQRLAGLTVRLAEARQGEPYDAVDWRGPCALIVGSEAAGPSDLARALAPQAVHIPMTGRAESLNAAVAAGIILFEAARQRR